MYINTPASRSHAKRPRPQCENSSKNSDDVTSRSDQARPAKDPELRCCCGKETWGTARRASVPAGVVTTSADNRLSGSLRGCIRPGSEPTRIEKRYACGMRRCRAARKENILRRTDNFIRAKCEINK
jgi:hypothetical protein